MLNVRTTLSAALLCVAVVFGGGGSPAPVPELIVQLCAMLALIAWIWLPSIRGKSWDRPLVVDPLLIAFACLFAAIPILQLIPLPPAIWHALPGREIEIEALRLVGRENSWMPISVAPTRTLASALSLIPPLVMLFFVSQHSREERSALLGLLAALGVATAIVGALQLAGGKAHWLRFYDETNYGYITGFQANRNAAADILLMGLIALGGFVVLRRNLFRRTPLRFAAAAAAAVMGMALILTGSRSGVGLAVLVCAGGAILFVIWRGVDRATLISAGAAALLLGGLGFALADNAMLQRTWSRFESNADIRAELWSDAAYAVGQYWPIGSGIGTIAPVLIAAERLEVVDASTPNRVHNDFLEFTVEAGLVGILFMLAGAIALASRALSIFRHEQSFSRRVQAVAASAALGILALHSIVDYPMRSMSLACIAAMLIGLLSRTRHHPVELEARQN